MRLARPDNPEHPRAGQVGEVVAADSYPADTRRGRAARILLWVRFRKATWDDWRDRRLIDETYGLFDHEVEEAP